MAWDLPPGGVTDPRPPSASRPAEPDVLQATILELQAAMEDGSLTSKELVEIYLERIAAYDLGGAQLNAILQLNPHAKAEAEALDRERARGMVRGPLHGIPVVLKDNYDTFDMPTTGGSVALVGLIPPDDAFQVKQLREAGAIILAKTNMHELAMGTTTVSSLGGQTRNPYDPTRNPGGSTGGTGAAVAAAFGAVGWGTDTCGSIRIPSCFNNLFALRPTKGLSSIDGIIPLSHTQDVGAPMARNVTDLAIALDATVGPDPADPATRALEGRELPRFLEGLEPSALMGVRLGLVEALFKDPPEDEEVDGLVRSAIGKMVEAGAEVVQVEIPELDDLVRSSAVIDYEAKYDLMDYFASIPGAPVRSLREILDRGYFDVALEGVFRHRDQLGTRDSGPYLDALAKRALLAAALLKVMDDHGLDGLVYPSVRLRPAIIGEPQGGSNCQVSAGSGFPAMAIPAGQTANGLPTGLELLGRPFDDARLVAMAFAYEQAVHPWRVPPAAPPLVKGKAPARVSFEAELLEEDGGSKGLTARFTFDPVIRALTFHLSLNGFRREDVLAVSLQREGGRGLGSVLHHLEGPGLGIHEGTMTLTPLDIAQLRAGRLFLVLYTTSSPEGRIRAPLRLPEG